MARRIDYSRAKELLDSGLRQAEEGSAAGTEPSIPEHLISHFDAVFSSSTQAYREVLLGCVLVRILDKQADIRRPYVNQSDMAYSGRTLDEQTVSPFLMEHQIPSSRGPYLSVFRRQVQFDSATRDGLRDKTGYDAFLAILSSLESQRDDGILTQVLVYLLYRFVLLREQSKIPIARIQRISLRQYERLLDLLMSTPSGGLIPVMIVNATLETIRRAFSLDWIIECQGINVADRAAGVSGDIVISRNETVLMGIEVTERPVDEARVSATFRTKIAPGGIGDYVFMVNLKTIGEDAIQQADQYFAQGHEVNFVDIRRWVVDSLVTVGQSGRSIFNQQLQEALSASDTPQQVRVAWNAAISDITSA